VKLLFDHNLSPNLVPALSTEYPGSTHIREDGLARASDQEIWDFAKGNGFAIVSKDSDFHQLSFLYGHPPKVIWIRRGNCSTREIERLLREYHQEILQFDQSHEGSFLALL